MVNSIMVQIMGNAAPTLQLLGGFHPNEGLNARHQALFAYLALRHPVPVSRSELAFTLWAGSTEEQALTNLRKALHHIKQALPIEFIQADTRQLQLSRDLHLDLGTFTAALDAAERAHLNNDPQTEQASLEAATASYKGDLLPGLYDDWLIPERERLRGQFIHAMDRLIVLCEARQHYRDAIQHAQRLLQADTLREETYRSLIRLHALNNDRAAALNIYHICVGTLSKELGVEPDADTREQYERLLKSETRLSRNTPTHPMSAPLVAREAEWRTLLAEWRKASQGGLCSVLLSGEAGIGKTRLSEDFLDWAGRQGIQLARAACYSAEGHISFAPVADWLRSMPLDGLDARSHNELARILPELREDSPPLPMTESWQRQVFFEAMARGVLSVGEPTVLFLDDIQWCDGDTLAWLRYFLHFDKSAKILLLITLRAEELPANNELQLLLLDLRAESRLTDLELSRLDEKQTAELGAHLLGKNFSEADSSALFRESEGVPLFVVELANTGVRVDAARKVETGSGSHEAGLPPRLKAVLESRLARLSSPARAVIEAAAVIGREFDFDLLRKISELDEGATVNALDELWRLHMIRERGGRYDFSHDKLREATLTNISPMRLRWLHQRVAETLDVEHTQDDYARIAEHFERAGKQAQASAYFSRAAEYAGQLFAFNEALEYYRRAILLEKQQTALANLHEGRGDVLKLLGMREDAFRAFDQALNFSEGPLQKARLARKQIDLVSRFDHATAREKYRLAAAEIARVANEAGYWQEWIELQFVWLQASYWRQDLESQEVLLAQLREPLEKHGTPIHQVKFWHHFINSLFVRARYFLDESHVSLARDNLERATALGDSHLISTARQQYGMVVFAAEQLELSELMFREAIALSEKNGNYQSLLIARTYIAVVHRRMQRLGDVRADLADLDLLLQKLSKNPQYAAVADANRAWLAYHDGQFAQAGQLAQAALNTWRMLDSRFPACWLAAIVLLALAADNEDIAGILSQSHLMLEPYNQRLSPELEAALRATLEADPVDPALILHLGRKTVEVAKKAGYL